MVITIMEMRAKILKIIMKIIKIMKSRKKIKRVVLRKVIKTKVNT